MHILCRTESESYKDAWEDLALASTPAAEATTRELIKRAQASAEKGKTSWEVVEQILKEKKAKATKEAAAKRLNKRPRGGSAHRQCNLDSGFFDGMGAVKLSVRCCLIFTPA